MDLRATSGLYCLLPKEQNCVWSMKEREEIWQRKAKKRRKKKSLLEVGCIASGRRGVCEIIKEAMKNIMREQEECPAK